MNKKNADQKRSVKLPVAQIHPARKFVPADDATIELRKLREREELLWLPDALEEGEGHARRGRPFKGGGAQLRIGPNWL
jgi:hypothetical protein